MRNVKNRIRKNKKEWAIFSNLWKIKLTVAFFGNNHIFILAASKYTDADTNLGLLPDFDSIFI
jgi:hypothetical protein